jgi:hypothetical protein
MRLKFLWGILLFFSCYQFQFPEEPGATNTDGGENSDGGQVLDGGTISTGPFSSCPALSRPNVVTGTAPSFSRVEVAIKSSLTLPAGPSAFPIGCTVAAVATASNGGLGSIPGTPVSPQPVGFMWSSQNQQVATVNTDGNVSTLAEGFAPIDARINNLLGTRTVIVGGSGELTLTGDASYMGMKEPITATAASGLISIVNNGTSQFVKARFSVRRGTGTGEEERAVEVQFTTPLMATSNPNATLLYREFGELLPGRTRDWVAGAPVGLEYKPNKHFRVTFNNAPLASQSNLGNVTVSGFIEFFTN